MSAWSSKNNRRLRARAPRGLPWAATSAGACAAAWLALWPEATAAQDAITFDNATLVNDEETCVVGIMGPLLQGVEVAPKGIIFFVLIFLCYLMWAMTFVVERILLPSVHLGLAQGLRLPDSLTSPALLAIGGCSVPILFLNVFGMSRTESSAVGVGLVLGSAALNFFMILPVCYFTRGSRTDAEVYNTRESRTDAEVYTTRESRTDAVVYIYWWAMVRDLTVYVVGLALLSGFWFSLATPWEASVEMRDQACWLGQETQCCYQGLLDGPERLAPIEYGVLTWWEGLCMLGLYGAYLVLMRFQHRAKGVAVRAFDVISVCFCARDAIEGRQVSRSKKHLEENEDYAKVKRQQASKNKTARILEKITQSRIGATSDAAVAQRTRAAGVLQLLAGNTLTSGSVQYQRASAILVIRQSKNPKVAFAALKQSESDVFATKDLEDFVHYFKREIIGKDIRYMHEGDILRIRTAVEHEMLAAMSKDGETVTENDFIAWFTHVEARLIREMNAAFDLLDEDELGEVSVAKLESVLQLLGCHPSKQVVRKTRNKLEIDAQGRIGRTDFNEWYRACMAWSPTARGDAFAAMRRKGDPTAFVRESLRRGNIKAMSDETESPTDLWGRKGTVALDVHVWRPASGTEEASFMEKAVHALGVPVRLPVYMTTVVCTGPAEELTVGGGVLWLTMALFWLGLFSWGLLFATETISLTLKVPSASLGSTLLALGLNASHIISSVLRAATAEGDKRGSSIARSLELSIKGNLFDLLVSLPFAWLVANAARGHPTHIGASNIGTSLLVLLVFVVLLLILWTSARWRVDGLVAAVTMSLYILFLIQDVILSDWAKSVPSYIYCSGCSDSMVCASV